MHKVNVAAVPFSQLLCLRQCFPSATHAMQSRPVHNDFCGDHFKGMCRRMACQRIHVSAADQEAFWKRRVVTPNVQRYFDQ